MRIRSCILLALSLGWTHRISAESLYSVTDLGTLGGCCTEAHGINNVGQVTGSSSTLDGLLTHAFLYRNGQMMDLNDSFGRALVVGNSVINPGHVVGVDRFLLINPFAFSYYSGQVISLGALGGGRGAHSAANSVYDSGQVTGFTSTGGASTLGGIVHAFLYSNGQMQDLRTLSGTSSSGESINNVEQVTGQSFICSGASHAFLSVNGDMLHLNTLIDPALGAMLADAPGINDRGQIAANGFYLAPRTVMHISSPQFRNQRP